MNDDVWWYATRAAGLMTWATAFGSVLIGLFLSLKSVKSRTGPWFFDLHRFLSSVSVIFLVTHLGTLYLHDADVFTWKALLIPGESTWETTAASMGVIALWSLVAVEITSLLRNRISNSIWRVAHALSVVTVAAGTYHAWLGGSDVREPVTWAIAGLGSLLVVALVAMRLQRKDDVPDGHLRKSDHEELLVEMRNRLESLPVPEQVSQPELKADSAISLPRRAPLGPAADGAPTPDLFDAFSSHNTPLAETPTTEEPMADLPTASAAPVNPFGGPEPAPDSDPWDSDPFSDSPFGSSPFRDGPFAGGSPFGDSKPPAEPVADSNPFEPTAPPVLPNDLGPSPFGSEAPPIPLAPPVAAPPPVSQHAGLPPLEPGSNPFASPEQTPAPAMAAAPAPPPLPTDAVNPATGQPDEAAYTAWLVEWLAFAEKYGEEAPEDPSRV